MAFFKSSVYLSCILTFSIGNISLRTFNGIAYWSTSDLPSRVHLTTSPIYYACLFFSPIPVVVGQIRLPLYMEHFWQSHTFLIKKTS